MTPCALTFLLLFSPIPGCFLSEADPAGRDASIAAFGRSDPHCAEWTDGCVVCVGAAGHPQCSTPGIACTPAAATCTRRAAP